LPTTNCPINMHRASPGNPNASPPTLCLSPSLNLSISSTVHRRSRARRRRRRSPQA
jgi:hypothetical protein